MRLFIAIPLAAAVIDELSAVVARLRQKEDGLRWASAESWHITLQFLGNASPEQYRRLTVRLCELHSPFFSIGLESLGCFDRAGIFFAGVQVTPQLLSLQQSVTAATSRCGFVAETHPFHPHITLARAKGQNRDQRSGGRDQSGFSELKKRIQHPPAFSRFTAQEFNLYESFLGPGGSRYEIRDRFPLAGE